MTLTRREQFCLATAIYNTRADDTMAAKGLRGRTATFIIMDDLELDTERASCIVPKCYAATACLGL